MGTNKALIEVDGVPLGRRVAEALLAGGCERVVLIGGGRSESDLLWLSAVPDRWPGEGPLGGIATAVLDVQGERYDHNGDRVPDPPDAVIVVAPCDQPDLQPELIARLVAALADAPSTVIAAAPVTPDGRRHPVPAAWRRAAGHLLLQAFEGGERRADAGFRLGDVVAVPAGTDELRDLDTPIQVAARQLEGDGDRGGNEPAGPDPATSP